MLFSRAASFVAFFLTLGILAVAKPVELDSRASTADVENIVATLKSQTDAIVPQIKSAAANPQVSSDTVTPLVDQLVSALNTAQSSLTSAQRVKLVKRQSEDVVAQNFAGVVNDIAGAVVLLPPGLPGLGGLIVSLDVALSAVLQGLDVVLVGVGSLVGGLLTDVAGLLDSLGFGLVLGLLDI